MSDSNNITMRCEGIIIFIICNLIIGEYVTLDCMPIIERTTNDKSNLACTYEIMRLTFKNNLQTDFQGKVNDIFVVIILCSSARGSRKYE